MIFRTKNLVYCFLLSPNLEYYRCPEFALFQGSSFLVIVYLLEDFSFSVGSECCFFSLKSTPFPCRHPLPEKVPLPFNFLFLLGGVFPCGEWLPCILKSLAHHGPATSFSYGMFHCLNKYQHNIMSCCTVTLSNLHAFSSMVGSLATLQLLLPSCWHCCPTCQTSGTPPLSHLPICTPA